MARNVLESSLLGAGFSIIFQILCRILTFGINAYIVRNVGREVLGIMNVRLLLLESTLLFLSREAINRAALSANSQQRDRCSWAQLINQMWLTVPICAVLCGPCLYIWLNCLSTVDAIYSSQYEFACYAVAVSCVLELFAESTVFVAQVFCFVKLKILLNTLHIFVRSAIFLWIVIGDRSAAITAFGIAQLASAVTIVLGQYGFFYFYIGRFNDYKVQQGRKKQPTPTSWELTLFEHMEDFPFTRLSEFLPGVMYDPIGKFFNRELQTLTLSFVKQGVLKQILTEGEKYVMSVSPVLSFGEQATYDVVNNLGSMAARFIFRPIEDSSYFYFTQTISRDTRLAKQPQEQVRQASSVLNNLLLGVSSIGLLAFTFGQSYSYPVLLLYGGPDFVAGGLPQSLLQWHCLAIYLLSVNGISEGYMFATNTSRDIDKYNYLMAIFSVSFLVLSYILTGIFGPVGFIFANCINMLGRILYSTYYIRQQYQPLSLNPLQGLKPAKLFGVTLIISGIICYWYQSAALFTHLGIGLMAGIACLLAWALAHRDLVRLAWRYGRRIKID
ncbi:protein RFT1 homolog [Drosophila guanche]|uniref:Protein RFT1 homolog n=2 Tax=Drosophila guanche TaxID=7266 RepID=A0A3B0KM33_DROGU|nr:protein RFT1 homolog [Drosophila guanche]SPP86896.1 blast:Protein RFT1 homolog [Drosophila guanche]